MDPNRFDRLTRSLGQATSRRTVLRALGAAALGALGLPGGRIAADAPTGEGPSECVQWCQANFDGASAERCTSMAAHGGGPCYGCEGPRGQPCPDDEFCMPDGTCKHLLECRSPPCCGAAGEPCADSSDCCDGVSCENGACAGCVPAGMLCFEDDDCCPGQVCTDYTCHSCVASGDSCSSSHDCCSGMVCTGQVCTACPTGCAAFDDIDGDIVCGKLATIDCGACPWGDPCSGNAACIPDAGDECYGACVELC